MCSLWIAISFLRHLISSVFLISTHSVFFFSISMLAVVFVLKTVKTKLKHFLFPDKKHHRGPSTFCPHFFKPHFNCTCHRQNDGQRAAETDKEVQRPRHQAWLSRNFIQNAQKRLLFCFLLPSFSLPHTHTHAHTSVRRSFHYSSTAFSLTFMFASSFPD